MKAVALCGSGTRKQILTVREDVRLRHLNWIMSKCPGCDEARHATLRAVFRE
jgi:hypothetical protein